MQRPCDRKELGVFDELKEGHCAGGERKSVGEREMRQDRSLVITGSCHGFGTSLFLILKATEGLGTEPVTF